MVEKSKMPLGKKLAIIGLAAIAGGVATPIAIETYNYFSHKSEDEQRTQRIYNQIKDDPNYAHWFADPNELYPYKRSKK